MRSVPTFRRMYLRETQRYQKARLHMQPRHPATHTVSQKFLPLLSNAWLMACGTHVSIAPVGDHDSVIRGATSLTRHAWAPTCDLTSSVTTGLSATLVVIVLSFAMPMVAHLAPTPKKPKFPFANL